MPTHANFTTVWTITESEFGDIQRKPISKIILPSYNNVVFRFRLEFNGSVVGGDQQKLGMNIFYEEGPLRSLGDSMTISLLPRNNTQTPFIFHARNYYAERGGTKHWTNFEDKDINTVKNKYGLDARADVQYFITVIIPLTAFDYKLPKPEVEHRPSWLTGLFGRLESVEKPVFSDVRFVARDGDPLYCHQVIVGRQSKELETMLKNPRSDGEKSGVFYFPSLDTGSLNAIVKYLYTGEYDSLVELSVPMIIQVADFSEQYGLKVLKEACIAQLWETVVENPKDAIEILRFADLHPEAKYLKDRAMSVIMENFEKLSLKLCDFLGGNENDLQGDRLREEYVLYTMRRLWIFNLS